MESKELYFCTFLILSQLGFYTDHPFLGLMWLTFMFVAMIER